MFKTCEECCTMVSLMFFYNGFSDVSLFLRDRGTTRCMFRAAQWLTGCLQLAQPFTSRHVRRVGEASTSMGHNC